MDTDTTATDTTTGAADAQGNNAPDTTGTAPEKTFTQAEIDKMITDRLSRERKAGEKNTAELQAELEALRKEKEDRALAELTEIEKAQKAAEEAAKRAGELELALTSERVNSLRANIIANEAATLPQAYKALITGSDEATIKESVASALSAFEADRAAYLSGITTPEQLKALGEAGEKLFATVTAKGSIGAPPSQGQDVNVPDAWGEGNRSIEAWAKERERRGIGKTPTI